MLRVFLSVTAIGLANVALVAFGYEQPWLVLIGAVVTSLLLLGSMGYSTSNLQLFASVAVAGAALEAVCVWAGAWQYATPQLLGLPVWLPLIWGQAGLSIAHWYKELLNNRE